VGLVTLLVTALGATGCADRPQHQAVAPATERAAAAAAALAGAPPLPDTAPAPPAQVETSPPVEVALPRIRVASSGLELLHLASDGALQAPKDFQRIGWYADGPAPGDVGPAVLAGHVDSKAGPAVFFRLRELRPGDRAVVTRGDGRQITFVVDRTQSFAKDAFPVAQVYAPTPLPELRLVTCTGAFDSGSGHYRDNLVVFAHALP